MRVGPERIELCWGVYGVHANQGNQRWQAATAKITATAVENASTTRGM